MQAAIPRRLEYATAASILLLAMALAAWIIVSRTALKLPAPVTPPNLRVEAENVPNKGAAANPAKDTSPAGAIELVELPADLFPAPKAASQSAPEAKSEVEPEVKPESKPVPKSEPAKGEPAPQPAAMTPPSAPLPAPRAIATAAPLLPPAPEFMPLQPEPPSSQASQSSPKPIVPLQPEPVQTAEAVPIPPKPLVPLRPEAQTQAPPSKPIVPLHPESRPVLRPELRPEPPHEQPMVVAAQPQLLVPLTPERPEIKPVPPTKPAEDTRPAQRDEEELAFADTVAPQEKKPQVRPSPPPKEPQLKDLKQAQLRQEQPAPRVIDTDAAEGEGRALLRIFEQGSGPSIEIKWPSDSGSRDRLYAVFVRCLGMRVGVVDSEGRLFLPEGQKSQPFNLNTDIYSSFVRRPEGAMPADEQREVARVRNYHGMPSFGSPARIFPRHVDAYLIGGLRLAVGDGYLKARSIHAAYRLSGGHVLVDSIVADGQPVTATIDLSAVATGCAN